jgi:RNA polymerase sigma-70 factor, ECF subfamily
LALKITKDPSTSEEVVEDTYYQIWQEIYRYDFNRRESNPRPLASEA